MTRRARALADRYAADHVVRRARVAAPGRLSIRLAPGGGYFAHLRAP